MLRGVESASWDAQRHDFNRYGDPHPRLQLAYRDVVGMFPRVRLVAVCALPEDWLAISFVHLFRIHCRLGTNSVYLGGHLFLLATFEVFLLQICSKWLDSHLLVLLGDLT